MDARYPRLWLMTDERMGDALVPALRRLPPGSGVVFRHYSLAERERRALFREVRRVARARRLVLTVARPDRVGRADGVHATPKGEGLRTWPAHDRREAVTGARAGASLLFVSPVFPTRSHPNAPALGLARATAIGRGLGVRLVALGGMTPKRFRAAKGLGFHGWAAIDALHRAAPSGATLHLGSTPPERHLNLGSSPPRRRPGPSRADDAGPPEHTPSPRP